MIINGVFKFMRTNSIPIINKNVAVVSFFREIIQTGDKITQ